MGGRFFVSDGTPILEIVRGEVRRVIVGVFQAELFPRGALLVILMLAGLPASAQSGTDATPTSPPQSFVPSSTLNGNWQIAGNRMKKQFPLISMYLHVDGTQIVGSGDVQAVCPNDPRNGGGGIGGGFQGQIAPDGSFTLRNGPRSTLRVELSGQVPAEGEATWNGKYTLAGAISSKCSSYRQTDSFTATPVTVLNGTFFGSLKPAQQENSPLNFSMTIAQGGTAFQKLSTGQVRFYLALTGKVQVKGSTCFSHGSSDPLSYSTHGSLPSRYSTLGGDALDLWFEMDDESQLVVQAVFAEPGASGLAVTNARVVGGKCDHQSFTGALGRK
jgi:hypothetical protein